MGGLTLSRAASSLAAPTAPPASLAAVKLAGPPLSAAAAAGTPSGPIGATLLDFFLLLKNFLTLSTLSTVSSFPEPPAPSAAPPAAPAAPAASDAASFFEEPRLAGPLSQAGGFARWTSQRASKGNALWANALSGNAL